MRASTPTTAPARSPRPAGKKRMHPLHVGRVPQPDEDHSVFGEAQAEIEGRKPSTPDELHEQMSAVQISPGKRMGRKIEASKDWIKKIFNGKTERKKKARAPGRPLSRAHLYEEAQVGTARRVSIMPIKVPHPSQSSSYIEQPPTSLQAPGLVHLQQPCPSLQPPPSPLYLQRPAPALHRLVDNQPTSAARERSSTRRTTRAMMEGYD